MTQPTDRAFQLLEIDKHRLDEELNKQPQLFREHADILATAKREAAEAKADLKLRTAEAKARYEEQSARINLAVRDDPQKYGIEKVREDAIKAAILMCDEYQDAHHQMLTTIRKAEQKAIEADEKEDLASGVVESYRERKSMVEKTVDLWLSDYWAEIRTKGKEEYTDRKIDQAFTPKKGGKK